MRRMAEEVYYQTSGGGEIKAIPFDQIPSFDTTDTTRNTPISLDATVNYTPNGWTTVNFSTYDPNAWTTTTAPYLGVDRNGIVRWFQNGQPGEPYGLTGNDFTFTYPSEPTRHADPKPEPVDTHELDEFIDSLKVVEGESEEYDD